MIVRALLLATLVLAAGCPRASGPPPPRRGAPEQEDGGGWKIVGVEPEAGVEAGAAEHRDDAPEVARDTEADGGSPIAGDEAGSRGPGAGAGADGGDAPARVPSTPARTAVVPPEHPQYGRLEGEGLANACKRDGECAMGGCAREVCSAERGVTTTCEALPVQLPTDAACGCVGGECIWYSRSGTRLPMPKRDAPVPNEGDAPKRGPITCGKTTCKPGQQCIEYFGIAGASGPRFESCEWPCGKGQPCPKGTRCTTISDGPGRVCR